VRLQPVETLSKGFKRRVGLAAALLHDPPVLVLDEPTDGLDPNQKHEVRNLIRSMAPEKAIVISTHILEEVSAVCSRAVIIARGKVVADETPAALAARGPSMDAVFRSLTLAEAA
jgi:ABC-2 type transport system ATP-binding protein